MNRLLNIIDSMDQNELKLLQQDLYEGNIASLIKKRLKKETFNNTTCPVCGSKLENGGRYALEFGQNSFRKKAKFCEMDCLEFFISQLKDIECRRWQA